MNFSYILSLKIKLAIIIAFCFYCNQSFSQSVNAELVVSAGYTAPTEASFSSDGRMLATILSSDVIKIWDMKTGREIRSLIYKLETALNKADSCWFTDNNKTLMVSLSYSNDIMKFDIETKKMTYIKSETAYDYTNMRYSRMFKSATNLTTDKKTIFETASDEIHQVAFKHFITSGLYKLDYYNVILKNLKTGNSIQLKDTTTYGFSAISNDSKYIFVYSKVYDFETGKLISEFKSTAYTPFSVAFLPKTHTALTCGIGGVRIWDFPNVKDIVSDYMASFYATSGYKKMLCDTYNSTGTKRYLKSVDIDSLKVIDSIEISSNRKMISAINENASQFVTFEYKPEIKVGEKEMYGGAYYEIQIIDLLKKKKMAEFISGDCYYMPGSNELFMKDYTNLYGGDSTFKVFNIKKNSYDKLKFQGYNYGRFLGQSLNKKYIFNNEVDSGWMRQKLNIWELPSGKKVNTIVFKGQISSAIEVSFDNKILAFATNLGNDILVFSFPDGKPLFELKGHSGYIFAIAISEDNKRLLSASYDGTKKLWNLETGKEILSIIDIGEDDYAVVTPEQYYYCTKGATKYIHFVKNLKVYPFEQFDLKYNRPDIIMQLIGSNNIELEKAYKFAHEKRIKKMGFTEEQLSGEMNLPEIELKNSANIPPQTTQENLKLEIKASDAKYKLDRLLVRINGVPMGGVNGISLKEQNFNNLEKDLEIQLSGGKNKVEVSVMNSAGVESIAESFEIMYDGYKTQPTLYIVTIGVSKYIDDKFNLNYAAKDAENTISLFKKSSVFNSVKELVLNNENATLLKEQEVKTFLEKAGINDYVIVFVAGHGVLDAGLNYYIANHDMNFEHPEQKGLSYEKLEDMLNGISARNKLLLIDACHSGELDKEEMALATNSKTESINEAEIKFRSIKGTSVKQIGLNNSFEMMKELFADIRKGNGTVVISSAGGAEYAMEGKQWNNGVFTYCLLTGLGEMKADFNNDKQVMLSELQKYLQTEVQRLTNGKQKPTSRTENLSNDWRVW